MKKFVCRDLSATEELGHKLGNILVPGDVVCLTGDLGVGKTALVKAVATTLGVATEDVTSPTFSLLNIYQGKKYKIKHFDLYRLNSEEELEDIGFDEELADDCISFIEWSELFPEALPVEYLQVTIKREGQGRSITLEPLGKHYEEICEKV
jgi:tRNA threonylcarbamoyladenosine biosynthesis protein TsaE